MTTAAPIVVVGSGLAGTAVAWSLCRRGFDVEVLEKGPDYPYPHRPQFEAEVEHLYRDPAWRRAAGIQGLTQSGDYRRSLDSERHLWVGGAATRWEALTPRLLPADFATRTRYGHGVDWPLAYDDLEPWYVQAECWMGVAGTTRDNPFAPPRSAPYPLPPFPLSWGDRRLAERLAAHGLALHTTPQARTSRPWDGREACLNVGTCRVCPIGARYSPNVHLGRAVASGRCRLRTDTSARRVVVDAAGRARAVTARTAGAAGDEELGARAVVVAGGAFESARLLLLSGRGGGAPGLPTDQVGRHLLFHSLWTGRLHYREPLWPGRSGPWTGQSDQFADPPERGRHGGVKIELSSRLAHATDEPIQVWESLDRAIERSADADQLLAALSERPRWRPITFHAESVPGPHNRLTLSAERDRHGDPFAHVHYELGDFDRRTHAFAAGLFRRFREATGADDGELASAERYYSGFHHMGGCRMGDDPATSVVDAEGRVHGVPGLWVVGSSVFPGTGSANPSLTLVALALRTADALADELATPHA